MSRPKRIDQVDLLNLIKETAWQQIAENGAAALSLRAIARALHITAPAIYNYYASRDDLVTALVLDAYTSMGDAQFGAFHSAAVDDHVARLKALGYTYRQWAVTHPQHYQLIFGTPIPGYHAPAEITMPAASRSLEPLINCLADAHQAGKLRILRSADLPVHLHQQFKHWQQMHPDFPVEAYYAATIIWSRVHGLVSLEIGSQFPQFLEDVPAFYQLEIDQISADYLLDERKKPIGVHNE